METKNENSILKYVGRIVAGSFYDMQAVRIATKNRIRDIIRKKIEGIPFDAVEEKKEDDESSKEPKYKDEELFELFDACMKKGDISKAEYDYTIDCWNMAESSEKIESQYKKAMLTYVGAEIIYTEFLQHVRGLGPVLSTNLLKEFGYCQRYDTISKLWSHSGNGVLEGKSPKRHKGEDIHYSPRLRTMTWKISDSLLKQNKGLYRNIYDTTKAKMAARIYPAGELKEKYGAPYTAESVSLRPLHSHNMALRKMRKIFLSHYWMAARELTGQSVREPFAATLDGHASITTWKDALKQERKSKNDIV